MSKPTQSKSVEEIMNNSVMSRSFKRFEQQSNRSFAGLYEDKSLAALMEIEQEATDYKQIFFDNLKENKTDALVIANFKTHFGNEMNAVDQLIKTKTAQKIKEKAALFTKNTAQPKTSESSQNYNEIKPATRLSSIAEESWSEANSPSSKQPPQASKLSNENSKSPDSPR